VKARGYQAAIVTRAEKPGGGSDRFDHVPLDVRARLLFDKGREIIREEGKEREGKKKVPVIGNLFLPEGEKRRKFLFFSLFSPYTFPSLPFSFLLAFLFF
jgi:hypothetical protein